MNKTLMILCVLILLSACTGNKARKVAVDPVLPESGIPFEAPAWLWQIPAGSYAVGFGYSDTFFSSRADSVAKEFAAVSLSRNHSAFVVDKEALYTWASETQSDWSSARINLVVSSDIDYLKRAHRNLQMVDAVDVQGYRIGLFGFIDGGVDKATRPMRSEEMPDWCVDESTTQKGNTIYCVASGVAASLPDAWNLAQEKALRLIGKYRVQKVKAIFETTDDIGQRRLAVETVTRSYKAYFDKSFIVPMRKETLSSYKVYVRLRSSEVQ